MTKVTLGITYKHKVAVLAAIVNENRRAQIQPMANRNRMQPRFAPQPLLLRKESHEQNLQDLHPAFCCHEGVRRGKVMVRGGREGGTTLYVPSSGIFLLRMSSRVSFPEHAILIQLVQSQSPSCHIIPDKRQAHVYRPQTHTHFKHSRHPPPAHLQHQGAPQVTPFKQGFHDQKEASTSLIHLS